jgi:hypothetical protein
MIDESDSIVLSVIATHERDLFIRQTRDGDMGHRCRRMAHSESGVVSGCAIDAELNA